MGDVSATRTLHSEKSKKTLTVLAALAGMVSMNMFLFPTYDGSPNLRQLDMLRYQPANPRKGSDPRRVCLQNPYTGGLDTPLLEISERMDAWLANIGNYEITASTSEMSQHDKARFFPFQVMASCNDKACIGGECHDDTSKIVCGLQELTNDNKCIIYSIGGNNHWEFELDLLKRTSCQVHTFDCTGPAARFQKPDNDRLHFHHVCLGITHEDAVPEKQCKYRSKCGETWSLSEMQNRLGHKRIDLVKMDSEGFEWPIVESWPEMPDPKVDALVLPMQILMSSHYWTQFPTLLSPGGSQTVDFRVGRDVVNLQAHLLRLGYVVVDLDDDQACLHCTEVTLIRSRCPESRTYTSGTRVMVQSSTEVDSTE